VEISSVVVATVAISSVVVATLGTSYCFFSCEVVVVLATYIVINPFRGCSTSVAQGEVTCSIYSCS